MKLLGEWKVAAQALNDNPGDADAEAAEQAAYERWTEYAHDRAVCYYCGNPAVSGWNQCADHAEAWMA